MLDSLHIENMAVIERLDVDFPRGLCVITGETGAGKSVMLDALAFLLGGKADRGSVRHGAAYGNVSAVFSGIGRDCRAYLTEAGFEASDELLLQRTLTTDGKSKCRLNGRAIPQTILREVASRLVSIHGQNDNQRLMLPATQQTILDSIALEDETLSEYRALYDSYRETEQALRALKKDAAEAVRLADILRFQITEIEQAHLKEGEEEELLARRTKLQNTEKIAKQSEFAYRVLHGAEKGTATLLLERAAQALRGLSDVIPDAAAMADKLMNMRYEVEDIANTAREYGEDTEGDPTAALNRAEARLDTISKLRRKYGADIAEILAFATDAKARLSALENSEEEELRLTDLYRSQAKQLRALADRLHDARLRAAAGLQRDVMVELGFLDMPFVRFHVSVEQGDAFYADGNDTVAFMISTNPGDPLQPLAKIASGGELARIMLAVKSVLNERDGVPTAIFDEIDTGISGKTSRKIGMKLSEIGRTSQVLCVTHSAQVASLADAHFKITKTVTEDAAFSTVTLLDDEARVAEVARILGGLNVTRAQTEAARDMIREGRSGV